MSKTRIATTLLRSQFKGAHDWLEGTMMGVTNDVAAWQPPGRAHAIGAAYLHLITNEDYFVNSLLTGGMPLMANTYASKTGMSELPPRGNWSEWSDSVTVDIEAARGYAQAVYAATDAYLA